MRKEALSKLPIIPEEYGTDCFASVGIELDSDPKFKLSEMLDIERKFINGLVRYYEPENILEVGVSSGGGSAVLLDAVSDIQGANLTSIDLSRFWYRDQTRQIGFCVKEKFSNLPHEKWNLILGEDPAKILPSLKKRFDFAVIDTAHVHPVEAMNFLTVLPFLNDGAIVVVHDISLCVYYGLYRAVAPRIIWSTAVGDKLVPRCGNPMTRFDGAVGIPINNIGAFQISQDTRKYIRNVFESLMMPWEVYPDTVDIVGDFVQSYYDAELMEIYKRATAVYKGWYDSKFDAGSDTQDGYTYWLTNSYRKWQGKPVVFYGAGQKMRDLIALYELCDLPFDYPIWDIDAERIGAVRGHTVIKPDFDTIVSYGHVAVVTILNRQVFSAVRDKLEDIGFIVMSIDGFAGLS